MHYTAAFRAFVPPPERSEALPEPRRQEQVPRHTVEHNVDILSFVQILDVPVPQMDIELEDFMQALDTLTPRASSRRAQDPS